MSERFPITTQKVYGILRRAGYPRHVYSNRAGRSAAGCKVDQYPRAVIVGFINFDADLNTDEGIARYNAEYAEMMKAYSDVLKLAGLKVTPLLYQGRSISSLKVEAVSDKK